MNCPRCQGLLVKTRDEEYCLNCGHRTDYAPTPHSAYRPLDEPRPEIRNDIPNVPIKTRGKDKKPRRLVLSDAEKKERRRAQLRKHQQRFREKRKAALMA